jgi:hypothetical protein
MVWEDRRFEVCTVRNESDTNGPESFSDAKDLLRSEETIWKLDDGVVRWND